MNGRGAHGARADFPPHPLCVRRKSRLITRGRQGAGRRFRDHNVGDFMRGVARMKTTDAVRASRPVGTDTAGGFSVPNVVMRTILDALIT